MVRRKAGSLNAKHQAEAGLRKIGKQFYRSGMVDHTHLGEYSLQLGIRADVVEW